MMQARRQLLGCLIACALPVSALAQEAYLSAEAQLLAGPEAGYPVVATLGAGTPVIVQGCVADYSWCDVVLNDLRGWVYAAYLDYPYRNTWVPLATYGPSIGVPIVGFAVGNYWDRYYRGRPWYGDRGRWEGRPGPAFRPGGPPVVIYDRPGHGPGGYPSRGEPGFRSGFGPDYGPRSSGHGPGRGYEGSPPSQGYSPGGPGSGGQGGPGNRPGFRSDNGPERVQNNSQPAFRQPEQMGRPSTAMPPGASGQSPGMSPGQSPGMSRPSAPSAAPAGQAYVPPVRQGSYGPRGVTNEGGGGGNPGGGNPGGGNPGGGNPGGNPGGGNPGGGGGFRGGGFNQGR